MSVITGSILTIAINVATQYIYAEGRVLTGCSVSFNNEAALIVPGNCKEVGEQYYRISRKQYPAAVVTLVVDGVDYNKV